MYYVLQVGSGREARAERLIQTLVDPALFSACFHPLRHEKKKIRGQWTHVYRTLIPGYVFLETENAEAFSKAIRRLPAFLRLLGTVDTAGERVFCPLPQEEEAWLKEIIGLYSGTQKENLSPVVELSQVGFTAGDEVRILSGPLLNFVGKVRRLDLHRRYAEVEVEFLGQKRSMRLGIEIVEKCHPYSQE